MTLKPERPATNDAALAIVLPTLFGGGSERVATDLANYWTSGGRQVSLITIDAISGERYPLDARIQQIGLGLFRNSPSFAAALWNNRLRVSRLRHAIRERGVAQVVSFTDITNITTLLACRRLNVEVIVCERTDPRHHRLGRLWSTLRAQTYGRASAIVVQTHAVAEWAKAQGWNCPVYVIPNAAPVPDESHRSGVSGSIARHAVVALGRLSHEKGFDLLIEAFARVAASHSDWDLRIYGEGNERAALTSLAQQHGIGDRVSLAGWTQQTDAALRDADIFVLPSRYEGFPNALLEAMAIGLPCISFDCDSGPRDIIRPGVDGLLVQREDVTQLAGALHQLMSDNGFRRRLSEKASEVTQRFSRDRFYRRWNAVLQLATRDEFEAI